MKATEDNFIHLIRKKNEKGLIYMTDHYGYIIKAVLRKHLFRLSDKEEECMNDVLWAVWQNIESYDPSKSSFSSWLAGVSRYKAIDCKRKYIKQLSESSLDSFPYPVEDRKAENDLLKVELEEEIEEILSSLSLKDREIFRQVFLEEESIQSVAKRTGMKEATVYQRISRGRSKLRAMFGKGGQYEK